MKLTVTPIFPGSSKFDGTKANPCHPGSLRLKVRTRENKGAVDFQYSIKWIRGDYCKAEDSRGNEVVLNKFHNYGWEGMNPTFGLPPTHNRKENPAGVVIGVEAKDMGDDSPAGKMTWTQEVWYYTKLCQCRFIDDYGEEWLEWDMWQRRARSLGLGYVSIRCVADNQRLSTDKVYYKIMTDKYPDVFKKDMFGSALFTGTKQQLIAGVEEAERILDAQTSKPAPIKNQDLGLTQPVVSKLAEADRIDEKLEAANAEAKRQFRETEQGADRIAQLEKKVDSLNAFMEDMDQSLDAILDILRGR